MTSTPVKSVGFGAGATMISGAKGAADTGFQEIWNNQAKAQTDDGVGEDARQPVGKTSGGSLKARDEHRVRTEKREPSRDVEERADISEEKLEEAAEVLGAAAVEVISQLADALNISTDEVVSAMEELEMQPLDALNPQNLNELFLAVAGAEDASVLVTDEALYDSYKDLMLQLENVMQESAEVLEQTPEQLIQELPVLTEQLQMEEVVSNVTTNDESETTVEMFDDMLQAGRAEATVNTETGKTEVMSAAEAQIWETQIATEQIVESESVETITVSENTGEMTENEMTEVISESDEADSVSKARSREATGDTESLQNAGQLKEGEIVKPESQMQSGSDRGEARQDSGRGQESNLFAQNFRAEQFQTQIQQTANAESVWSADTQDIMRQIMDYMRINLKPDMSSMELQLHPASLGNLQVQVTSKGGVVTASFITQNEAVKAALETQMIQLQEQFQEQGVKVEAIEVTVQTHQFEQNLEQGRGGNRGGQEPSKRGRTRRINLNDALAMDELEEEDALVRDMMEANGNTVDYSV